MRLSDSIELFIKNMMEMGEPEVELKRNELAEYFGCAPSQINYVLSTRFTVDDGYVTESRRGGGGYIRIVRVVRSGPQYLQYIIRERIGDKIDDKDASRLISQLEAQGIIKQDEARLMEAAVSSQSFAVPVSEDIKNAMRAKSMKNMLTAVARSRGEEPLKLTGQKEE